MQNAPSNPIRVARRGLRAAALTIVLLALAGCGLQPASSFVPRVAPGSIERIDGLPANERITVVSKNFTEQIILGKMTVLALTAAGFDVRDMTNVPGSQPSRELMLSGGADVSWEYTGTAWLTYLGEEQGIADPRAQFEAVRDADATSGLTWLEPAPLNNTYALAVREEEAERLGITKLSQIADIPVEDRTICVESEFNSRSDGLNGMLDTYDIPRGDPEGVPEGNVMIFDTGAVYTAVDGGTCTFGEVFTTDGRIDSLGLRVLEDDRGYFPAYNGAPVVRTEVLERYPQIADVLGQIAPALTDDALRQLNLRVDENGEEPVDVAFDFLVDNGFIAPRG